MDIIDHLKGRRERLKHELRQVEKALESLRGISLNDLRKVARRSQKISLAGRRRIAAAQRLRWARIKARGKKH